MTEGQFKLATLITHGQIRAANQSDFICAANTRSFNQRFTLSTKPFIYEPEFKHLNFINKVRYVVSKICRPYHPFTLASSRRKAAC